LALAERILAEIYNQKALRVRMGATIPIGLIFRHGVNAETVFFSFSTADEDYHAPNEFFRLQRLKDGMRAWVRYWQELGQMDAAPFSPSPARRGLSFWPRNAAWASPWPMMPLISRKSWMPQSAYSRPLPDCL